MVDLATGDGAEVERARAGPAVTEDLPLASGVVIPTVDEQSQDLSFAVLDLS